MAKLEPVSGGVKMQETSQFENEVTLGATGMAVQGGEAELTPPRAEEDGFMEDLEEDPAEEDRCAPGGKKTQPKKTAFSNRPNYRTFRTAMTTPTSLPPAVTNTRQKL